MKDLKIADFNRFEGEIMVETIEGKQYVIAENVFEDYLKRNSLLSWEFNFSDHTGSHVQTEGEMTLDEYFFQADELVKIDIVAYLQSKIVINGLFGALNDIFSHFKTA